MSGKPHLLLHDPAVATQANSAHAYAFDIAQCPPPTISRMWLAHSVGNRRSHHRQIRCDRARRRRLACAKLLGQVVRIFMDTVATWYRRRHVELDLPTGGHRPGAMAKSLSSERSRWARRTCCSPSSWPPPQPTLRPPPGNPGRGDDWLNSMKRQRPGRDGPDFAPRSSRRFRRADRNQPSSTRIPRQSTCAPAVQVRTKRWPHTTDGFSHRSFYLRIAYAQARGYTTSSVLTKITREMISTAARC